VTLAVGWALLPLVLGLVSLGCGLLLETTSATRLPGALVRGADHEPDRERVTVQSVTSSLRSAPGSPTGTAIPSRLSG